jgi:hypothetical protein
MHNFNSLHNDRRTDRATDDASVALAPETRRCFVCGHRLISRGSRFCGECCRNAFDMGLQAHDPNQGRRLTALSLAEWRVVAGPPGLEIKSQIYAQFLNTRPRRKRRKKVSSGPQSTNSNFSQNNDDDSTACERTLREVRAKNPPFVMVGRETLDAPGWRAMSHGARSLFRS